MIAFHRRHAAVALVALLAGGCAGADDTTDVDPSVMATASDLGSEAMSELDTESMEATASDALESASEAMSEMDTESAMDAASTMLGDLSGIELPEGFPTDVPVPEGFVPNVVDSQLDDAGPSTFTLDGVVEGDEDPEVVVDKLITAWQTQGWEVTDQSLAPGDADLADIDFARDGDTATVSFTQDGDGLAMSMQMDVMTGMEG